MPLNSNSSGSKRPLSPFGSCWTYEDDGFALDKTYPSALVWSKESGKERQWESGEGGYYYTTPDDQWNDFYMQCPEGQHVHITTAAFAKEKEGDNVYITLFATLRRDRRSLDVRNDGSKFGDDNGGIYKSKVNKDCAVLERHDIGSTSRDFNDMSLDGNKKRGDGTSYYQDAKGRTAKPHELVFMIQAHCYNPSSMCNVHARVEWECVEDVQDASIAPAAGHLRAGALVLVAGLLSLAVA